MSTSKNGKVRWISFAVAAVICICVVIFLDTGDIGAELTDTKLEITSSYWRGKTVALSEVQDCSLETQLGRVRKVTGLDSLRLYSGRFSNEALGEFDLYIYRDCESYIVLQTAGGVVVVNAKSPEATAALYEDIQEKLLRP